MARLQNQQEKRIVPSEHIVFVSSRMGFKDEAMYTDAPQPYGGFVRDAVRRDAYRATHGQ